MFDHWFVWLSIISLLGLAVVYDVAQRRIPNWLVLTGLLVGAGFSVIEAQAETGYSFTGNGIGLVKSLLGALTGLTIMLPLYFLRAMGGGDVKLMAAVGAFLGTMQVVGAALLTFIAGGVLSLIVALWSGSLSQVLGNLRLMGMLAMSGRSAGLSLKDVQTTGRLPYAVAITVGTGLQIWLAGRGGWIFV